MAKERLEVHGEMASALREYAKLIEANKELKGQLRQVRREARETKRGFDGMQAGLGKVKDTAMGIAGALGIGVGVYGAVQGIVRLVQDWKQYMGDIAQQSRDAGREMTAMALLQEGGEVRKNVLAAAALGAGHGQTMGASWSTVQRFQAKTGSFEGGMDAARAAFRLSQMADVPLAGATSAVSVGMGLGLTPQQGARAAYAAGEESSLSPAELAEMSGRGLPAYLGVGGGPVMGYGVAAALSGLIDKPSMLGTYTRQVGTLLQQRTGAVGATWKRLGFETPGADPMAQLRALRDAGITTMGDLQEAGFAKKESQGLSIILADLDKALKTMEGVATRYADVGAMERKRAGAEAEMPEMGDSLKMDILERGLELERTFGANAPRAREIDIKQRVRALAFERHGLGHYVKDGKATTWDEVKAFATDAPNLWEAQKAMPRIREQLDAGDLEFDVHVNITPKRRPRTVPHGE